ncbi:MAG: four helix bundle protein [Chlorobi bacterium]|nr:four helix bundle protein [Chlorobiota bacterium]
MNENIVRDKSFKFAVRIVNFYKLLIERKEYVMSKQILRSGTSIGANIREAQNAQSNADFIHKLSIAQKETDETLYWLELLKETEYISETEFDSLSDDCTELLKLLRSIIITSKNKSKKL